jgi:site-specific DNA-methyltransferase (adenine-specific)
MSNVFNHIFKKKKVIYPPIFETQYGALFNQDCLDFLPTLKKDSVDMVFADPPYNLGKNYGSKVNDNLDSGQYIKWSKNWISQCARVLKPGGSFFLYNIPKWNIIFSNYLLKLGLDFRHWIVIDIKLGLPIRGRLYPSHYSLLYFTKGKPKTFNNIRIPIEACRHCGKDIKDYGGHRNRININGLNLSDVWNDISPVRHAKFKNNNRKVNQLSTKLLERVVNISTNKNDIILDPFGGSGTTYYVSESLKRFWLGTEIEDCNVIIDRLTNPDVSPHKNNDFLEIFKS